jgi:hypothetical protein
MRERRRGRLSWTQQPPSRRWWYWFEPCGCNGCVMVFEPLGVHLAYELTFHASTTLLYRQVDRTNRLKGFLWMLQPQLVDRGETLEWGGKAKNW